MTILLPSPKILKISLTLPRSTNWNPMLTTSMVKWLYYPATWEILHSCMARWLSHLYSHNLECKKAWKSWIPNFITIIVNILNSFSNFSSSCNFFPQKRLQFILRDYYFISFFYKNNKMNTKMHKKDKLLKYVYK